MYQKFIWRGCVWFEWRLCIQCLMKYKNQVQNYEITSLKKIKFIIQIRLEMSK